MSYYCTRPQDFSVDVLDIHALNRDMKTQWQQFQNHHLVLSNPFFSLGYHELIARCEQQVKVAVIKQHEQIIAFWPFELVNSDRARPVGSIFCDYQGIISPPGFDVDPILLLQKCHLSSYQFDHLLGLYPGFKPFVDVEDVSWTIDVHAGFDTYASGLRRQNRKQIKEAAFKLKKLEKEVGPTRFVAQCRDHDLLNLLMEWKSEQWSKSGWHGRFTQRWEEQLFHELLNTRLPDFSGIFSVLFANDSPIAMHIGMKSQHIWHCWTTAYDPAYHKYSPGIIKHFKMLEHAPVLGIKLVDLGKEEFEYKKRLSTRVVALWEGTVNLN